MIGTILLSKDGKYIDKDGKLPPRPAYDKDMLRAFVKDNNVSLEGFAMLPPSIQGVVGEKASEGWTMPITILELAEADLLLINRYNEELEGGKIFRLDNFKCIVKDKQIELWIKK
jgi:hypothetical protein